MPTARHHAEWLSLVETSGPFLSMPVLLRAFPQGLDAHDPDHTRDLRLAHEEWEDSQLESHQNPALHTAWIRFVLTRTLEFPEDLIAQGQAIPPGLRVPVAEHGETLTPDLVIRTPDGHDDAGSPRLLIQVYSLGQSLDRAVSGRHWKTSPQARMTDLLRGLGSQGLYDHLGLVTNGEHWMLVSRAAGEAVGYASWYASLWLEEPLTLRAFRSLLGVRRFFGVSDRDTIEALLRESASAQEEVTDQLGYQVRHAVEVLVQALDQADKDQQRTLLHDVTESLLYEAAVTVMMRLVFLFAAEERGLLLLGDPLFDQHYAVSTLRARLREAADLHGEEVLERRFDAWCRLLATFRAVHGGIRHDRLTLPAYGGSLFDPDRFPFLEGRKLGTTWQTTPARSLPVNNRTVLHLLEALQMLQVRVPGGGPAEARRLSFRALDIEQIGHVYEGLLDHTALRASAPVLGLTGARDAEEEVSLDELEGLRAQGRTRLLDFLKDKTKRSANTIQNCLTYEPVGEDTTRLLTVCDGNGSLEERVRPFAGLLREDTRGYPIVITPGSVYVTRGADRRSTGTHYTPRSLTEPLVQHALNPLVYEGPAECKPREQWALKPAKDLLGLRVCDMAMGSGAFLVQACRYLSARLVEAWEEAERQHPAGPAITPEGLPSTGAVGERLIPKDTEERLALARRLLTDRCLFGVDKNALAVEMAKLSLWLVTLQKDRPFTFLDHALKCGDSLLGVTNFRQIEWFHLDPRPGRQLPLWGDVCARALRTATEERRRLESFSVQDIRDAEEKERLLTEADLVMEPVRLIADLLVGAALSTTESQANAVDEALANIAPALAAAFDETRPSDERTRGLASLKRLATRLLSSDASQHLIPFHWAIEFPEIFDSSQTQWRGFHAVLGNPPFIKGHFISRLLGSSYRNVLVTTLVKQNAGLADLVAFFFVRGYSILQHQGILGLLATNTISEGDTSRVGLGVPLERGATLIRALTNLRWPSNAGVVVSVVYLTKGGWRGEYVLNGVSVSSISTRLTASAESEVYPLAENKAIAFVGSYPLPADGFTVTAAQAATWIAGDPRYADIVLPYINGKELYTQLRPSRSIICFWDWPEAICRDFSKAYEHVLLNVKPVRDAVSRKRRRTLWWLYGEAQAGLYHAIGRGHRFKKQSASSSPARRLSQVLVKAKTSNTWAFVFLEPDAIFDQALTIFACEDYALFAQLQSLLYEAWVIRFSTSHKTDLRCTPHTFETFARPEFTDAHRYAGEQYYNYRTGLLVASGHGLTDIYSRFDDPTDLDGSITALRDLQVELDQAVADAYGWGDLDLEHEFYETIHGTRFTISDRARQEVLARMIRLNHQRHTDEVRRGLTEKIKSPRSREDEDGGEGLFTNEEQE